MSSLLVLPRGKPGLPPLQLDMQLVNTAEKRLKEVAFVNPTTCLELSSFFNEACNEVTKYEAWIEYEILEAEKSLNKIKAQIIVDKLPALAKDLKDSGQKPNEAWRDAIITLDCDYERALDIVNSLYAVKMLLRGKSESFKRAYFSAKDVSRGKEQIGATPNLNGAVGQLAEPQSNFMGVTQLHK